MSAGILPDESLPAIHAASDATSLRGQRRFKILNASGLALLLVAAVGGTIGASWAGWLSAGAFLGAILATALTITSQAERDWYDGRAGAESIRSFSWKYAVGGDPLGMDRQDADEVFREGVRQIVEELSRLGSSIESTAGDGPQRTLRQLRSQHRRERIEAYHNGRLRDQRDWYANRAASHRRTVTRWRAAMFALQALGLGGAAVKGLGLSDIDWLSVFATAAASATAWLQAGDYVATARAYDFASLDLRDALGRLADVDDEAEWARFVSDCETAISREHTMWLARRRRVS